MADVEQIEKEIAEIRASALAWGGLPILERVEVALGGALRHLDRMARGGRPLDYATEAAILAALTSARKLIERPRH